jgi:hypothetical protein
MGLVGLVINLGLNKNGMVYAGVLPADGPVGGFASKSDRILFWDTTQRRGRLMVRTVVTWVIITIIGSGIMFLAMNLNISLK